MEVSQQLGKWSRTLSGMEAVCVKAFAEALEVIPYTLAENAGLNPIEIVTELRNKHATTGNANFGINVRKERSRTSSRRTCSSPCWCPLPRSPWPPSASA